MTETFDLEPAAEQLKLVVRGVSDDQLGSRTPCPDWSVGDLLDHVRLLSLAFTAAAQKSSLPVSASDTGAANLPTDWRDVIARQLDELVAAWRRPEAWHGMAEAGGVTLPAEVTGTVAVNELVMHGWDLARATGQSFSCDADSERAAFAFSTKASADSGGEATDGLFGRTVAVPPEAPLLHQALGRAGRDPEWRP